ncbi:annexin A7-like [Stegostoma tigrinum]|uniref:annexin A7-like n=1 Tax=Stegostoma tigrinum TaxID=3053191 RepID=UPI0028702BE4|nr:annexin A7-like [Stegostoma tigrinum]XP_048419263.2 annexin A7-like [Stegostoma tigrinum]XP_048419265.2 annexin A7-like [Stegostoma tigrinum]XP_048419266.2 annexin A7-like [Stegostoma tigrinum]XP_048419267.2 annexin A7-like [Stegostoma tigrinum]XP_048419268.2 annexin A7-like [Stegostoma tigrinum]
MSYPGYPSSGYPQSGGQSGYPQAGGQYPYPGAGGAYPPGAGGAYPPGAGGAYPPGPGGAYPQAPGPGGAYPQAPGPGGAYPQAPGPGGAYPQAPGPGGAYPQAPGPGGAYPQAPGPGGAYPQAPGPGGAYPQAPGPGGAYPQAPGPGGAYPQAPGPYGQPPAGGYPQGSGGSYQSGGGSYPASGGYPAPQGNQSGWGSAGSGYPSYPTGPGAPGTAPGYGGPQPAGQNYSGGGAPPSGGYPSGPAPGSTGPQPTPSQPSMPNIGGLTIGGATQGTIKPVANFNPQSDAEILRQAMKGAGTNEQAIIDVVSNRSNEQRQKIKLAFKTLYGKDLIKDLKSELTGNMEEIILALFMPTTYYDAWSLRKAMEGAGTQDRVLIEILCTRDNQQIREIVRCYKEELGRDLEKDLRKDTSGHFRRLLISMSQGNRDENQTVDMQKATADAERLFRAGEGKLGTDESTFNMILATRSFPQLRATIQEYGRLSKRELLKAVDREFSGDVRDGMHAIVQCVVSRPVFFAEKLYKSMKGAGTSDSTLIRIIVTRSEIDLVQIKQAFWEKYQKTLRSMVESDTSGDYKRLLVSIIGN